MPTSTNDIFGTCVVTIALGALVACASDGRDGVDGTNGTNGSNGAAGSNGTNGTSGTNGSNGANGSNGTNGSDGAVSLLATSAEPPGSNCEFGGTRVDSGVDTDGNGELDPDEITATTFICQQVPADAILAGDVHLRTAADLALLDHIQILEGTINVDGNAFPALTLPELVVAQGIAVRDVSLATPVLSTIDLPHLQSIGSIDLSSAALTRISVPALRNAPPGEGGVQRRVRVGRALFARPGHDRDIPGRRRAHEPGPARSRRREHADDHVRRHTGEPRSVEP